MLAAFDGLGCVCMHAGHLPASVCRRSPDREGNMFWENQALNAVTTDKGGRMIMKQKACEPT